MSACKGHFMRSTYALWRLQALIVSNFSYSPVSVCEAEHATAWTNSVNVLSCRIIPERTTSGSVGWCCGWIVECSIMLGASFLPYIISIRWEFSPCSAASRTAWLYHTPGRRGNNSAVLTRERAEETYFGCDHPFHTKLVNVNKPFRVREKQKHAITQVIWQLTICCKQWFHVASMNRPVSGSIWDWIGID